MLQSMGLVQPKYCMLQKHLFNVVREKTMGKSCEIMGGQERRLLQEIHIKFSLLPVICEDFVMVVVLECPQIFSY